MKQIQHIASAFVLLAGFAINANADDLNKVIIIDKEIVPELKEVTRINKTPQVPPLDVKTTTLNYNEKAKTTLVPPEITTLEPASNVDTIALSKYRGYAMLGYFPVYNLDLSAGYRILDKENMRLNAWLQYNGELYDATTKAGDELSFNDHELSLNALYNWQVNKKSTFGAKVGYTFNAFDYPWLKDFSQNVNRFNFDAAWKSSVEGLKYDVELGYSYFGYGKDAFADKDSILTMGKSNPFEAVKEHSGYVKAGASMEIDDDQSVALDFGAKMIHNNHFSGLWGGSGEANKIVGYNHRPYNHAILTLVPHYDFKYGNFAAKVGVKLDYQIDIDDEFNVSPDVYIDWNASSIFSAYAHFTGGVHQNSMNSIFEVSHYFMPSMAYENSKLSCVIDAGINVGPFKNATLEIFGGYARANDWYMPCVVKGRHEMESIDFDGWHIGVAASYKYNDLIKVRASYETAPQSYADGYYLWRDRAKHVVKASAVVTPISPLDITLDYEYRGGRCSYEKIYEMPGNGSMIPSVYHQSLSLGHVSNLSLGGLYRFTDQLSFFARLENILNHKYDMLYDLPSKGITGLVGATYKF